MAAEAAGRNLVILSGDADCSVEQLIDSRYTKNSLLGEGSSGTVYDVSPVDDSSAHFALKTMLKGSGNAEGYENTDEDMGSSSQRRRRANETCTPRPQALDLRLTNSA